MKDGGQTIRGERRQIHKTFSKEDGWWAVKYIKQQFPTLSLICGNLITPVLLLSIFQLQQKDVQNKKSFFLQPFRSRLGSVQQVFTSEQHYRLSVPLRTPHFGLNHHVKTLQNKKIEKEMSALNVKNGVLQNCPRSTFLSGNKV